MLLVADCADRDGRLVGIDIVEDPVLSDSDHPRRKRIGSERLPVTSHGQGLVHQLLLESVDDELLIRVSEPVKVLLCVGRQEDPVHESAYYANAATRFPGAADRWIGKKA